MFNVFTNLDITRYLHFDLKTERKNFLHNRFALASQLWN